MPSSDEETVMASDHEDTVENKKEESEDETLDQEEKKKKRNKRLRKKAEEYEDGRNRKQYASDMVKVDKGRPLDDSIVQYFVNIGEQFKTIKTMDPEMREIFIANVHSEVRGREYRLATRNRLSEVIDVLLQHSNFSQIKSFFLACRKKFYSLMVHHCGSHVLQTLLARSADVMMHEYVQQVIVPWHVIHKDDEQDSEEEDAESENSDSDAEVKPKKAKKAVNADEQGPETPMQLLFLSMCQELNHFWLDLMFNPQGSFNVRTILLVLSGCTNITKEMVQTGSQHTDARGKSVEGLSVELVEQSRSHLKHLRHVLADIVAIVDDCDAAAIQSLCYDRCAMPVAAALLKAIAARQRKDSHKHTLSMLIAKLLMWKAVETEDSSDDEDEENEEEEDEDEEKKKPKKTVVTDKWKLGPGSVKHVDALLRDAVGSHMLEAIISCAPADILTNFLYKHTVGKLRDLAMDRSANHVVQRLIANAKDETVYSFLFEQLEDSLEELVQKQRGGILLHFAEAGANMPAALQTRVVKSIAAVFGVTKTFDKTLLQRVLKLQTGDQPAPESVRPVQYIGARVATALVRFLPQPAAFVFASFGALQVDMLKDLMRDPAGARVVEAYLDSGAALKEKIKLVKKLDGMYAECACACPAACFVLEKMYMVMPQDVRTLIAKDLSNNERKVLGSRGGSKLYSKLRIHIYKKTYKAWEPEDQANKQQTIELFEDIIGDRKKKRADEDDTAPVKKAKK